MPDDQNPELPLTPPPGGDGTGPGALNIQPVNIEEEMRRSYLDYSMSVIIGRALPDVRDGLKPVHRRILYTMQQMGLAPNRATRKCARIVGDVMGKYHPHGNLAVYDALVRLAQTWSMDGHFVPNLTIGPPVVKSLRKATDLPLDCHLMIENADEFIPAFVEAGANWVSVHQEACVHLDRTLHHIREHGALAGVVINPATPVDMDSKNSRDRGFRRKKWVASATIRSAKPLLCSAQPTTR